jgi:hypothetical protein
MRGFGSDSAGGSADREPLSCPAYAAPNIPATRHAQSVVSFLREGGGLGSFVGEVALGRSEFRLACFALQRKIVETPTVRHWRETFRSEHLCWNVTRPDRRQLFLCWQSIFSPHRSTYRRCRLTEPPQI